MRAPLRGSERGERGLRGEGQGLSCHAEQLERGDGESGEKAGCLRPHGVSGSKFMTLRAYSSLPSCQGLIWRRLFSSLFVRRQESSGTRVRPSPRGTSSGCQAGLWSNGSSSDSDGGLAWLNQFRSGSSSGIHSLTACQGGSMGSIVSMSKGGGGGRGRWMMPAYRPWRRRKNSISSRRMKL